MTQNIRGHRLHVVRADEVLAGKPGVGAGTAVQAQPATGAGPDLDPPRQVGIVSVRVACRRHQVDHVAIHHTNEIAQAEAATRARERAEETAAAIRAADLLTTVSPTHAWEIQTPDGGAGHSGEEAGLDRRVGDDVTNLPTHPEKKGLAVLDPSEDLTDERSESASAANATK